MDGLFLARIQADVGHEIAEPGILALEGEGLEDVVLEGAAGGAVEGFVGGEEASDLGRYLYFADNRLRLDPVAAPEDAGLAGDGQGADDFTLIGADPAGVDG